MSKLDGNERWKSKMLLTEHKEQYEMRDQPKLSGRPTSEELIMIREYILYPQMLKMIQKSNDDMGFAHIALKGVIMRCLEYIMFSITNDFYEHKKELRERNIKVVEEEINDDILYYRYYCRGYDEKFGIVREVMRTEIRTKFTDYTMQLGKQLKSNKG
ncbi:hypothetical protein PAT3040_00858 [Paenibacillus agaridevorans]|uniref:Uncharacterized protein n=1 Tax=Paenibacillus agaridevorans TaxID=171404 RepID=A0A2R5ERD5_9BACL|nr:hypothetical protein [Paenibacillus agaridevorans]GBG06333.1 hypothetical protein PAT3040_00858 [Paenibacillus agaridevorans]